MGESSDASRSAKLEALESKFWSLRITRFFICFLSRAHHTALSGDQPPIPKTSDSDARTKTLKLSSPVMSAQYAMCYCFSDMDFFRPQRGSRLDEGSLPIPPLQMDIEARSTFWGSLFSFIMCEKHGMRTESRQATSVSDNKFRARLSTTQMVVGACGSSWSRD